MTRLDTTSQSNVRVSLADLSISFHLERKLKDNSSSPIDLCAINSSGDEGEVVRQLEKFTSL